MHERRKRKRGRPLFEELRAESGSKSQFYSPKKIERARELQREKDQGKRDKKARKAQAKLNKALQRAENDRLRAEQVAQRAQDRQIRAAEREVELARRRAIRQADREARSAQAQLLQELKTPRNTRKRAKEASPQQIVQPQVISSDVEELDSDGEESKGMETQTRRGRISRPPRYLKGFDLGPK
ncbi:hypothetical protein P152DRAFT_285215 [Eremomyces bilateralis CBS 781.70]|uniref:Uncharacterized protein n=1 Tax=Eremomyces bilateralis CBS 781.70 TaxID=1392243 RepID=A0A6G1FQ62_9PEZI|nr:uncharacterized protein P152DRAFT_285215 [Eremomyces bilateralis CBS 781.70]KAF1807868.1 hypothetical protein P152DRAFT_285215 [Eremomyces bilateralis CBS 781.70]